MCSALFVLILTEIMNSNGLTNAISTTKYSILTWLPRSILEQFRRIANAYFLLISVLMVGYIPNYKNNNIIVMIIMIFIFINEIYYNLFVSCKYL